MFSKILFVGILSFILAASATHVSAATYPHSVAVIDSASTGTDDGSSESAKLAPVLNSKNDTYGRD